MKNLSVYELTKIIDDSIANEPHLRNIQLIGELTQFTHHSSGHMYFTLVDDGEKKYPKKAVIRCTYFKFQNKRLKFQPKNGSKVILTGSVSIYYPGGQYNFNVLEMQKAGEGDYLLQIQLLKEKLLKQGIIDPTKRKNLPILPKKIGIVTGIGTAALRDIFKQAEDRYPNIEILIAPAQVQGEKAAQSIANAINEISQPKWGCDLLIIGRGGGSLEDLMAFNEEEVAMAIHESNLPIISGVGHQVDHLISDEVADVIAATPTDAAKIALPVIDDMISLVDGFSARIEHSLENKIFLLQEKVQRLSEKSFFTNPMILIEEHYQRLDELDQRNKTAFKEKINQYKDKLQTIPQLDLLFELKMNFFRGRYDMLSDRLEAFSPLATLKRGYTATYQKNKIIRSIKELDKQKEIKIQFYDGSINADIIR